MRNFYFSNQNKLVISGLIISTVLIFIIAVFSIINVQNKLKSGFEEYSEITAKTLASKTIDKVEKLSTKQKLEKYLISYARILLDDNKEISDTESSIENTIKDSIIAVFLVAWVIFAITIIINGVLITRELNILHHGVRQISGGRFGYRLNTKGVSGNVKTLIDAFNSMSERLHRYEEQNIDQLTIERNKLEAVLMSIVNGVIVCDGEDNVTLINKAAGKMLGILEKDILNTKIQEYKDSKGEYCFKEKIEQFKDTPLDIIENKPIEFNVSVSKMTLKSIISPMFSSNDEYIGYLIVLINITKEAETDKLKSQFISNVSHELRTPVTVLRTYADTLSCHYSEFDEETKLEFLGTLNSEIARLHKMVNDILDLSRVESPDANLEMGKFDIISVIKQAVLGLEVLASEKNISISFAPKVELPLIMMNLDSIDRVMKNLISNAIKYSPENTKIEIDVYLTADEKFVEVTVKDQGIGIEQKDLEKIFERFYRVENEAHTVKGTGIGLNLVKTAIEAHHNGKVFVTSKIGEGSTFGFRIPVDHETINELN